MSQADPIVIVGAARTAMGGFQGALAQATAPALGSAAIGEALARSGFAAESVDEVVMGCVLPAGLGQAPARQAALGAGLPQSVPCATLNKVCGSGMKATMLAADLIAAGSADLVVAGGMESMSNAPYLLDKARAGYRLGHGRVLDHMFLDGLEDAYDKGRAMGISSRAMHRTNMRWVRWSAPERLSPKDASTPRSLLSAMSLSMSSRAAPSPRRSRCSNRRSAKAGP
jgi:acetyl-CoA C-acetyltransferase